MHTHLTLFTRPLSLFLLIGGLPAFFTPAYGQARYAPAKAPLCYLSIGGGPFPQQDRGRSFSAGLSFTIGRSAWGSSLLYRSVSYYAASLPDDYVSPGFLSLGDNTPRDKVHTLSLHLLREQFFRTPLFRLGLEAGPSLVRYSREEFSLNTAVYTSSFPGMGFQLFAPPKYVNAPTVKTAYGLSVKAKLELPYAAFTGMELNLYGNINSIAPVAGMEWLLTLGRVREKLQSK